MSEIQNGTEKRPLECRTYTVNEIARILGVSHQAVRWELIARNPVLNATLPKEEHKEREIWTADKRSFDKWLEPLDL